MFLFFLNFCTFYLFACYLFFFSCFCICMPFLVFQVFSNFACLLGFRTCFFIIYFFIGFYAFMCLLYLQILLQTFSLCAHNFFCPFFFWLTCGFYYCMYFLYLGFVKCVHMRLHIFCACASVSCIYPGFLTLLLLLCLRVFSLMPGNKKVCLWIFAYLRGLLRVINCSRD